MKERDDFSEALELARHENVDAEQIARLGAALAPLYGPSIAAESASTTGAQTGVTGMNSTVAWPAAHAVATKLIVAVLAAAAVGTVSLRQLHGHPQATRAASRAVRVAPVSRSVAPAPIETLAEPIAELVAAQPTPEPPVESARAALHQAVGAPQRSAEERENAPREAQLLTEAHAALRGDAARALRLADRHRARFPHGALAVERELVAITALEQLRRPRDAAARRERARRELPDSAALAARAPRSGLDARVAEPTR